MNASTGWYDLAFRNYDPVLGRFMQVDPLAVVDESKTTYGYAGNNPIIFNDPSGLLVSAVGHTDGQLRAMWRADRQAGGPADFGDWAQDNVDMSFGMGDRQIDGGNGRKYSSGKNGTFGYWVTDDTNRNFIDKNGEVVVAAKRDVFITTATEYLTGNLDEKSWFDEHFYVALEGHISVGPQATFSIGPGYHPIPSPFYTGSKLAIKANIASLTVVGVKTELRKPIEYTSLNDREVTSALGFSADGNTIEFSRKSKNGQVEYTLSGSILFGLLGGELNVSKGELFIGMMPNGGFSLLGGVNGSFKAGFKWK